MKPHVRLLAPLLLLARLAGGTPAPYVDAVAAVAAGQALVTGQANGLGPDNLICTVTNATEQELRLRVAPGLHFEASNAGAQDLFTCQQVLLVLAPRATQQLRLRGFCMEHHDFAPSNNLAYRLRGFAGRGLQPLGDSLQKYPGLVDPYAQAFVWAVTDGYPLPAVLMPAALKAGATNTLRYLASLTGLTFVPVNLLRGERPGTRTFAKKVIMLYHSPAAQVASLKVFGSNGHEVSTLFSNRKLAPGVVHYTYGVNAMVPTKTAPARAMRDASSMGWFSLCAWACK